jgi:outer membrane protein
MAKGGIVRISGRALVVTLAAALLLAAKEYKVGYIDTDRVIAKYEAAIEAKKELDAAIAKFEAKVDSLKTDYEQAKQEYESQQLTLSEEGKRAKMAEVNQRKQRYDSYLADIYGKDGKIDQKNKELIAPIIEKIDSSVTLLAADEGFALVLDATKAGIVYSQTGLDLTDLVVDELNRVFEPVAPAGTGKLVYAIMPIYNSNDQAQQDRVGPRIRDFVYDLIRVQPKADMVVNAKVDQELQNRGLQTQQVQQDKALEVARALDADYVVFGSASKQDRRIQFELSLVDVRLGTLLKTQDGTANRIEDLQEQVGSVVRVLLAAIEKP